MTTQTQVSNSDDSGVKLLIALVFAIGAGIVFLTLFALFRFLNRRGKYQHAYRKPSKLQNAKFENGRHRTCLGYSKALFEFPEIDIARDVSFDAYLLLRYIKLGILICFVGCLLTWTVLFPVSATSTGRSSELRIISFVNAIGAWQRFYAYALCAWLFVGMYRVKRVISQAHIASQSAFIFWVVTIEHLHCIHLQCQYYQSANYRSSTASRVYLVSPISKNVLRKLDTDQIVESTRRIFDVGALEGKVKRRKRLATQLEALETSLIRRENSERSTIVPKPPKIIKAWEKIRALNSDIQSLQTRYLAAETGDPTAVLIKFKTPSDIQDLAHYGLFFNQFHKSVICSMSIDLDITELLNSASITHIGLEPEHIIWSNLNTSKEMRVFKGVTSVAILGLFWLALFVPFFFFALLEDDSTPDFYPFFQFLNSQPPGTEPLITGVVPVIYTSLVTDILAVACRCMYPSSYQISLSSFLVKN
jgi:hypothetical protein